MQHPPKKQIKQTKKYLLPVLVLTALVLAAAFALMVPVIRERYPAQKLDYDIVEDTARTLDTRDAAQIERVVIHPENTEAYTLYMQDGALMLDRDGEPIAIEQDYQKKLLEILMAVSVQDTVCENADEAREHWQAMGLENPVCKAEVIYTDDTVETYEVGAMVHGGTDYYFRWSGAEGIYTCHSGVMEAFCTAPNLLIPFEQPSVYSVLVSSLSVDNANGAFTMTFAADGTGSLMQPVAYPVTADVTENMLTAAQNVRLGAYEAPLTQENYVSYGFDEPLCTIRIEMAEGLTNVIGEDGALSTAVMPAQKLTYIIGREEGDYFYTCAFEDHVYLVSRFLMDALVKADWHTMTSRMPAAIGEQDLLRYVVFETPQHTVEVFVERTERVLPNNQLETDAEGNILYDTAVWVNGEAAPQELLDEVLKRLNSFTVEGELPANAPVDDQLRWRVTTVTESGVMRVLEGYRLDVFSDAVAVDGVMRHYVYNEAINVLMTGLV